LGKPCDSLAAMRLFARVARTGSFSLAAKEAGLPQSSASRIVAALERELSTRLLDRTTRSVTLTADGAEYLARIEPILTELEEAKLAVKGTCTLRGTLRLGAPASIAIREIIPRIAPLMRDHPELNLEFQLKDDHQDLPPDGVDIAICVGDLKASGSTARIIGFNRRVIVASSAYLKRAGTLATPAELTQHDIIVGPASAGAAAWTFERNGQTVSVAVEGRLRANACEGATAAAVAGMGILSTGTWGCRAELDRGTLIRVLADWNMGGVPVHAVFPTGRPTRHLARTFADFLAEVCKP
jgi:DNA-binding transcriptional LysR family regulator